MIWSARVRTNWKCVWLRAVAIERHGVIIFKNPPSNVAANKRAHWRVCVWCVWRQSKADNGLPLPQLIPPALRLNGMGDENRFFAA